MDRAGHGAVAREDLAMTDEPVCGENVIPFKAATRAPRSQPVDVGVYIDVCDGPGGEPWVLATALLPLGDGLRLLNQLGE